MSTFVRRKNVVRRGTKYTYLQLVRNERIHGRHVQRVLQNLGREDLLDRQEVDRTIAALAPLAKRLIVLKGPEDIELQSAKSFGDYFLVEQMWRRLGLDEVVTRLPRSDRQELDLELLVRCMVINRLLWPVSKLAATRWVKRDVEFPGLENGVDVHLLYRAMDHLGKHKDGIEAHLFNRLMNLFTLDVSLVFYDTTLAHFEGEGMEELVRFSRKHRRLEKKEILICVIMSRDGFPIYHEVLPGNRNDVSTVVDVVRKLKERFKIQECVFVGDGGMHSAENIRTLEDELHYKTIIGVPLRKSVAVRDEILRRPGRYHTIKKNLRVKEVVVGEQHYVLGFNPEEARREKSRRLHLLESLQKKIDALPRAKDPEKARARLLADPKRAPYLWKPKRKPTDAKTNSHAYPLKIDRNKVRQAARYDGKHVIQTSAKQLTRDEVARAYRDLQKLEYCFKHLKSAAIGVRPVRHWRDRRIRAHVQICILALVIERMIQRLLDDARLDVEVPRVLEELSSLHSCVQLVQGKPYRYRSEPSAEIREILRACKIQLPPRVQALPDLPAVHAPQGGGANIPRKKRRDPHQQTIPM